MSIDDFNKKLNNIRNESDCENCKVNVTFEPIFSKRTDKIIAVTQVETGNCGSNVVEMFTSGSEGEILAVEMGFRDNSEEDEEEDF